MAKSKSRPQRWTEAVTAARTAHDQLVSALETLRGVQEEYEEWKDNLPDNLQNGGALADKLEVVCNLEIEGAADEIGNMLDEAEGAELPLGFGRD